MDTNNFNNKFSLSDILLAKISTHYPMNWIEGVELKTQIVAALTFIESNREQLIASKKDQYYRPQDYGAKKWGTFKDGGLYRGAHIQVSKEGDIILIPKHKCLFAGSGSSKIVRVGFNLETGKFIAATSIRGDSFKAEMELVRLREMGIDLAYIAYGAKIKAAIPLAEQGDLTKHLAALHADPKRRVKVISGCIERVLEQHQMGLVNRDIKPMNFLLDAKDEVHCLDLGYSDHNAKGINKYKGTKGFIPPEVYAARSGKFDPDLLGPEVDIYALGVTFHIIESGGGFLLPWFGYGNSKDIIDEYLVEWTLQTTVPVDTEYFAPNNVQELIAWMTHPYADQRPTIDSVKKEYARLTNKTL